MEYLVGVIAAFFVLSCDRVKDENRLVLKQENTEKLDPEWLKGVSIGMTLDQIRSVVPGITPTDSPMLFVGEKNFSYHLIFVPTFETGGDLDEDDRLWLRAVVQMPPNDDTNFPSGKYILPENIRGHKFTGFLVYPKQE